MKILRYRAGTRAGYGRLLDDTHFEPLRSSPFESPEGIGERIALADVELLAPVVPRRVFGVGLNYVDHIREVGAATPRIPLLFMKPDSAVIGPGAPIVYPREGREVHFEAELAAVIGKRARRVPRERALDVVLGYTCANDVSERVIQRAEMDMGALVVGKGFDSFQPLGPWVVTGLDPSNLRVQARLNGQTRQDSRTSDLLFDVPALIAYLSAAITLEPGDVIITGTPAGVGPMRPGDVVEIEVEGIGVLRNTVVAEDAEPAAGPAANLPR
jgi:2-keto-4-pentenoate hydratase/2-oxohepta-3-ene-1,7-dioic acid hydratase in catechol pathway